MTQLLLPSLAPCELPGCTGTAINGDNACTACQRAWGPFICRYGETPAWVPATWPACGHSFMFIRAGVCIKCGCSEQVPNERRAIHG